MRITRRARQTLFGFAGLAAIGLSFGIVATGRVGLELALVTQTPGAVTAQVVSTPTAPQPTLEPPASPTLGATSTAPRPTRTPPPTAAVGPTPTVGATDIPTPDSPRFGGGSGRLAFVSERDGNPEIYTLNLDGTGLTRLTYSDADDLSPRYSPQGDQIAFRANRDAVRPALYVMAADGSRQRAVVADGHFNEFPAWWPDGTRLAFDSDALGPFQLFIVELAGGGVSPVLTAVEPADDAVAAVSPDGARIAFQSRRAGDAYQIFTVASDGADLVRLTFTSARNDHPAWSPDGGTLVFVSERLGGRDLFVMNADGTDQRALVVGQGEVRLPRFSPDGRWILFSSDRDGDLDVYVVSVDGSDLLRLTDHPSDDYSPDWEP